MDFSERGGLATLYLGPGAPHREAGGLRARIAAEWVCLMPTSNFFDFPFFPPFFLYVSTLILSSESGARALISLFFTTTIGPTLIWFDLL